MRTTLHIKGMTCVSCETLIYQELKGLPGFHQAKISCRRGTADIAHDETFDLHQAIKTIDGLNYQAGLEPWSDNTAQFKAKATAGQWFNVIMIVAALYLLYRLIQNFGWLDRLNVAGNEIGYGLAILIGIVASVSTCLAVVGSVVLAFGAKYKTSGQGFYQTSVRPHLMFQAGRLITFFVLGGVLGLVGSWFALSQSFWGWFTLAVALILAWLGLSILGFAPPLSKLGFHLPKGLTSWWYKLQGSDHPLAPALLGGFTFFMPCGFTQSLQLFAMSTGDFLTGAYTMLFFGLGTAPVLLSLGVATSKFKNKKSVVLEKAIGFVVVLFAVYIFANGSALLGWNLNLPTAQSAINVARQTQDEQVVEMAVTSSGYQPSTFEIIQGVPVQWIINGDNITGCTSQIIVPSLNISQKLTKGENIIRFTPTETGTINFSCGMGMVRGKFLVKATATDSTSCPINPVSGEAQCQTNDQSVIDVPSAQAATTNTEQTTAIDQANNPSATNSTTEQVITMTVDGRGYTPDILYAKVGQPIKWVINAAPKLGCTKAIKIDDYNIYKELKPGENIIRFTPTKTGEILFSCGMEMVWGKFVITADGQPSAQAPTASPTASLASAGGGCGGGGCGGGCGCGGGGGCSR